MNGLKKYEISKVKIRLGNVVKNMGRVIDLLFDKDLEREELIAILGMGRDAFDLMIRNLKEDS